MSEFDLVAMIEAHPRFQELPDSEKALYHAVLLMVVRTLDTFQELPRRLELLEEQVRRLRA